MAKDAPSTKSKVTNKSSPKFADPGPSGRMSGQNSAGPQKPGVSSQEGRGGGKFAAGGSSGRMSGKNTVKNATPA